MASLHELNAADREGFVKMLDGIYEHSPWIAERAYDKKPFSTLAQLKLALVAAVRRATKEEQLGLVRAHPELAGKAAIDGKLTAESTGEQSRAGLTHCTPQEFERLQQLNADYNARFGFPFLLAVRGPRGLGLSRTAIIETFARRLRNHPADEFGEALRNIHRIAEIRLNDRFEQMPSFGRDVWDWAEQLAVHSEPGFAEQHQLTATYLTAAHRAAAADLMQWMRVCGFDSVTLDAVGNVVGRYEADPQEVARGAKTLLTGSHYDTVRNAGKYDGRLGILVPMAAVQSLAEAGIRLKFGIEVVGFAEEEGQRYKATFLGSSALTGHFDPAWLEQADADGITMREAMRSAGLPGELGAIEAIKRDPSGYLGFVEVHIEQGPVLTELDLPLGVVTSINGSVRYVGEVIGVASHAGTTPMGRRRDAACAVAELALYLEQRAAADGDSVGTIGMLEVPQGSINVVPGRCRFSLDIRAPHNEQRDRVAQDTLAELQRICEARGLQVTIEETMRAAAAPCAPDLKRRWAQAVADLGLPVHELPSGAGHDAMKLHELLPQAMLFVRGGNGGISHNPLEAVNDDDADLAVQAFLRLLDTLDDA
ncbi:MAG: 2-oxo-4-hydroxy-4-carboxy-5-ureidoimidazoline decarboxylase [Aquabacterium sp.]|jgi:N-carbamoyl-L-amino-acid hydrolase|nr:MAG: 2-oxo-4-hydroxy-4-carboxy-5-ureidoimidazoline decarboxylase [Aquabacterium sp.]